MMRTAVYTAGAIVFTFLMACSADSQVVNIWPGIAPGSENWTQKEELPITLLLESWPFRT